jgi:hypothetical protein
MSSGTRPLLFAGFLMLLLAAPARAQDGALVQIELTRTDDRIAQAQSVVAGSNNERAEFALSQAVSLQSDAKARFASSQYALAYRLTLQARTRADVAIAAVEGLPDPDRVQVQVERTRELLDRARDAIEECVEDRARAMLRGAVELQGRAEAALSSQRYLAALRLTMSARERGWRALRLCNVHEDIEANADRAIRRTDQILDRARQIVSERGNPRALDALRQATDLQQRAAAQFRAGHEDAALRLTQSARAGAYRAIRFAGGRL